MRRDSGEERKAGKSRPFPADHQALLLGVFLSESWESGRARGGDTEANSPGAGDVRGNAACPVVCLCVSREREPEAVTLAVVKEAVESMRTVITVLFVSQFKPSQCFRKDHF